MKILIICTGNSCRSQMAEGFLKALDATLKVYSAGTRPEKTVSSNAILVMKELGVDISHNKPQAIHQFTNETFDYVITVCNGAKEKCPLFTGKVKQRIHLEFEDPANATGTGAEILSEFRKIRDEILRDFFTFYQKTIKQNT